MASSTSYSIASSSFSLTRSRTLHKNHNSMYSLYPSQRQLIATGGASLSFPSWRTPKEFKVQNPHLMPRIQCIRDTKGKATPIDTDLWENLILKSETPVLVEFYASWCGPCKMVHRVIDEIATEYAGKLKCFVLNTDTDMKIAKDYEIKAVPVVLLFKNGQKCDTVIGTMPKEFYVAAVEKLLSP